MELQAHFADKGL